MTIKISHVAWKTVTDTVFENVGYFLEKKKMIEKISKRIINTSYRFYDVTKKRCAIS